MSVAQFWRMLRRELRDARALPFIAALAVGVAAVVLVAGLGDSVSRAIRMEARPLLGADVAVRAYTPLPPAVAQVHGTFPDAHRLDTTDLFSMVAAPAGADGAPGRSLIAEVKAVEAGWPWYGAPRFDPDRPLEDLLADDGVVVDPALLDRLGVSVGGSLRLGSSSFVVRGQILAEPSRMPSGLVSGPRVLVSQAGLRQAGLGETGARITRRALFRLPDPDRAEAFAEALRAELGNMATVETWADAQPAAQRSIEQTTSWMGLVALLSLLVGGVGVSQATRAWMARRLDAIAIQRTLGLTSANIATLALTQTALLSLLGSLVGAGLGTLALVVAPRFLEGLLPAEAVQPFQPIAVLRGLTLGVGLALLFAWQPLAQASRVSPLRVLRRDVEPLPDPWHRRALALLGLALGVYLLAWVQSGDLRVAAGFVAGLLVVVALGVGGASGSAVLLARAARHVRQWWLRHALAAAGRPGSGLAAAVVSLGLGVVVVLTTVLVEGRLYAQIAQEFPATAPSAFLIDVQPDQEAAVTAMLADFGAVNTRSAPVIVGRLLAVDGVGVDVLAQSRPEGERWQLTREQRFSYAAAIPSDNTFVVGGPFTGAVAREISVEERYADGLGVQLGSVVRFDIQGVPMDFNVTSIRAVTWQSFNINFFLMVEPGVLEAAPQSRLVTTQVAAARESDAQDALAAAFPNVSFLSVRSALAQARGLLERLAWGIRAVGGFTAAAGIAILAAGVAAEAGRRGRQVALLKTLGTTRLGVVGVLGVEYAVVGVLAGLLGSVGAFGLSWTLVTQVLQLPWRTDALALVGAVFTTAVLCAAVGVLANLRALTIRPAEVLRGE